MKNKDLTWLKSKKPFMFNDLFVYAVALIVVLVLFLIFIVFPAKSSSNGFTVYKDGQTVLTFTYRDKKLDVKSGFTVFSKQTEKGVLITVYTSNEKSGYNIIFADTVNNTAKVVESTCSTSKDCTHIPAVSNKGAIFCAPHGLKIVPTGGSGRTDPITGGVS